MYTLLRNAENEIKANIRDTDTVGIQVIEVYHTIIISIYVLIFQNNQGTNSLLIRFQIVVPARICIVYVCFIQNYLYIAV
jgi:hypothetical protein